MQPADILLCYFCGALLTARPVCRWENPLMGWTSTADPMSVVARSAFDFERRVAAAPAALPAATLRLGAGSQPVLPWCAQQGGGDCVCGEERLALRRPGAAQVQPGQLRDSWRRQARHSGVCAALSKPLPHIANFTVAPSLQKARVSAGCLREATGRTAARLHACNIYVCLCVCVYNRRRPAQFCIPSCAVPR